MESSAVAWLIASKTSDARMAELVHKNSPTVKPYVPTRVKRGSEAPPPRGVIGFDASPVPTLPLALDVRPLDAGSSGPPAPPVRIRNYITDEPLRLRPQALKQGTGALPPLAWAASPSG